MWVRMPGAERLPGFFLSASKIAIWRRDPLRGAPQRDLESLRNPQGPLTDAERIAPPITLLKPSESAIPTAARERLLHRSECVLINLTIVGASGTRLGSGYLMTSALPRYF